MNCDYMDVTDSFGDVMFKSNGVYTKEGKDVYKLIREGVQKSRLAGFEEVVLSKLNYMDRTAALAIYSEAVTLSASLINRFEKVRNN